MRLAAAFAAVALLLCAETVRAAEETRKPQPQRTAEQMTALRKQILEGLASPRVELRAGAGELLVATWPDSTPILDEALSSKDRDVRREAVFILERPELGDQRDRMLGKFRDADESVRRQAVRAAAHLNSPELERNFISVVTSEPSWPVRQEALRALRAIGTKKCLTVVLNGWISANGTDQKARFKQVLVAVLKQDCGDDVEAWCAAVEAALSKIRAPAPASPAPAPAATNSNK